MKKKVLTVDDSRTMREMVSFTLRGAGFDVVEANDGQQALVVLASHKVDLILADLNMPNMDGLTMVEKIRSELRNTAVNLIMLTTESSPNMKERGKAAGVKGWIVKPFKGPAVLETFKKLVA